MASATAQTFPGTGIGSIPDGAGTGPADYGAPLDVSFNVTGITDTLEEISLSMTLAHTWVGDLDVVLAPPGVTPGDPGSLVIFSRVGAPDESVFGDASDLDGSYVFEDISINNFWTAAASVAGGDTVPGGSYRTSVAGPTPSPAADTSLLAVFGSLAPAQVNGTWTLRLRDGAALDIGSVSAAALILSDVPSPPTITSPNAATLTELQPGTFNVTASGSLPISYSLSGALPIGVSFDPASGLFSGVPVLGSAGVYPLVITATNGFAPDATQNFNLTVDPAPAGTVVGSGVVHAYESEVSLPIPDNGCPAVVSRTFNVSDTFNVGGFGTISLGLEIEHPRRSDLQISLVAPNGAVQVLQNSAGGASPANINAMYSANDDAGNVDNDGDDDPLAVAGGEVNYRRLITVPGLDSFYSGPADGTWTLRICDDRNGRTGTLQRARLVLMAAGAVRPEICSSTSSYDWGANGDGAPFTSTLVLPDGITLSQISTSGEAPGDGGSGIPSYVTRTGVQGAHPGFYALVMDTEGDTELTAETVLFGFDRPVSGLSLALLDVDKGAGSTSWEDYVRVTGSGPEGAVPVSVELDNTTNLNFAGDWVEADTSADPTQTLGNVRYRFISAVDQVRIEYAQGNEPNTDSVFQIIGVSDFEFCADDYGDAPLSFCDGVVADCPRHGLRERERLFLGEIAPDGETGPQFSIGASGDDGSLSNDEAGSAIFPAPRLPGEGWVCGSYTTDPSTHAYCMTAIVTNTTGRSAQLVGWIDFNNNGVFDPGERSLPELESLATTGFDSGNIPDGSNAFQAVLVFNPAEPVLNNATPSMLRLRLTTDPIFFSDATPPSHLGPASDGEIVDQAIPVNTLPVTLAGFRSERISPSEVRVRWTVATEAGTLGYRVWQQHGTRGLQARTRSMIVARDGNTVQAQDYEVVIETQSNEPFVLEELATGGRAERFGPFALGERRGEPLEFSQSPWSQARSERDRADMRIQSERRASTRSANGPVAEILVSESGVQRVALSDLQAAGMDLIGRDPAQLRLHFNGQEVPLSIDGDGSLSPGNHLLFLGQAIEDSQYTRVRPYRLDLGGGQRRWQSVDASPIAGAAAERLRHRFVLDADRYYNFSSPTEDPWFFDSVRRSRAANGKTWTMDLPGPIEGHGDLAIELWGGLDYPGGEPDHRFEVLVNGIRLGERQFDGIQAQRLTFPLGEAVLRPGRNEIRINLLETGFPNDLIRIESIEIGASVPLDASIAAQGIRPGNLQFRFDGISLSSFETVGPQVRCGSACEQIRVAGLERSDLIILQAASDTVRELHNAQIAPDGRGRFVATLRTGELRATSDKQDGQSEQLLVIGRDQTLEPQVRLAASSLDPLQGGAAELLVIAPSRFLAATQPLLAARRAEGLSARSVDVEHLYEHYSQGVVDPLAIRDFLRKAYAELGTRYVLLVGGDTYDYLGRLPTGSLSDLPTLYGQVHPVVRHAPLDHLFADLDGDEAPELALGRLPVRTEAELVALVERILNHPPTLQPSTLFAAERANPAESADYAAQAEFIISQMAPEWRQDVQRVYLDDFAAGSAGIADARAAMVTALNQGSSLVAYFGHGAPTLWSRELLVQSSQLSQMLANAASSPIVTEFGCWGGYFVDPEFNTMSHGWLNAGQRGAVAMLASAGLADHESDLAMAVDLLPLMQQPGMRIGDAMRQAKREIIETRPEFLDIVRGLTLFGDPSMRVSQ